VLPAASAVGEFAFFFAMISNTVWLRDGDDRRRSISRGSIASALAAAVA
jgi:hypothetical protein